MLDLVHIFVFIIAKDIMEIKQLPALTVNKAALNLFIDWQLSFEFQITVGRRRLGRTWN